MMISRIWWHANDDIQNFDFLGCQWGKRAKNFAKWQKYSVMHHIWGTIHHMVCHASYLRNHTLYDRHLWYTKCKMIMSPRFSFPFFKILIFWVVKRVKEQKNSPKWQKYLIYLKNQPYIIWSSFMVHMCKRIISPGLFNFNFWVNNVVKVQKMAQNKKLSITLYISVSIHHMIMIFGTQV